MAQNLYVEHIKYLNIHSLLTKNVSRMRYTVLSVYLQHLLST